MAQIGANLNRGFHAILDAALRIDRAALLEPAPGGLATFDPASLAGRSEQLAFWINLYNDLVQDAITAFGIKKSVREDLGFFRRAACLVGGHRYSADDIEHGILRSNRRHPFPLIAFPQFALGDPRLVHAIAPMDPRVHFALNCASASCPAIATYDPGRIEQQLDQAAATFVNGGGVTFDPKTLKLSLSRIFKWYEGDFGGRKGVIDLVRRHVDEGATRDRLQHPHPPRITYQPYDWSLAATRSTVKDSA